MASAKMYINFNVEVWCDNCGKALCGTVDITEGPHDNEVTVRVPPCARCLLGSRDDGYSTGYDDGLKEAAG